MYILYTFELTSYVSFFLQKGVSPLYVASQRGYTKVAQALLTGGADPNLASMVWELV